jgi:predicted dithiol-disulfide oxidoreductase (DUF899 family)
MQRAKEERSAKMAKKTVSKTSTKGKRAAVSKRAPLKVRKPLKASMKAKASPSKKRNVPKPRAKVAKAPDLKSQLAVLEKKVLEDKKALSTLRKKLPQQEIQDYILKTHDGSEIRLSEMFGSHSDLILVHNMGRSCPYCTMWADGFTGLTKHLENRAAFVVVSKDDIDTQREFYQSRNWNFRMYSSHGTTFNKDLNFEAEDGGQWPGVSAFHKDESGRIFRTGYTFFGPGDDFCAVWPMVDLLREGAHGWEPKFDY